ncbi:unnamed protein product, partial [marine sediment metagenome]
MCGIAGIVTQSLSKQQTASLLDRMQVAQKHRGPDDQGTEIFDGSHTVGLAHRRLAIIDPEHGKQPMTTADGRTTIVFNGAIYNYLELRRELLAQGFPIKTYSDTEVLLYAYQAWGEQCVDHLNGMFAFVIYDRAANKLVAARDRVGVKPLYYYFDGQQFIFSSEIKAILSTDLVQAQPNSKGMHDYITFQFCLGEKTQF